uniref:Tc1-like transposase DDE domain-containing protein n=1 Tax=Cuerna arida TaxID=1464854 RepID=A0A1B6GV18_9HEMI
MVVPLGKEGRVIVLHAGSASGFVKNCSLVFSSRETNDYHKEMNHETFHKWFSESLMSNLTKPSIITMDNARYHSKILDKTPTTGSRKAEISEWLSQHGIPYEPDMKKAELL